MKIQNFTTLLLISFLSHSLCANTPARPSTPPVTDQQLTTLGAFFRIQTPEKIIENIKSKNILGADYAAQATTLSKYTKTYNALLKAVEETKIILSTSSVPNANKKIAINNLRLKITELYNSIQ